MRVPTISELLREAIANEKADIHTALPGKVVAYYHEDQTADVQPAVRAQQHEGKGDPETLPILPRVPVGFPRGGGYFVAFPLAPGDQVILVFSEAATGQYQASGEVSDPLDLRRHSVGYAWAIPAGAPDPSKLADAPSTADGKLVVGKDGNDAQIVVSAGTVQIGKGATDFAALASVVNANFTAVLAWLAAHTHPGGAVSTTPPPVTSNVAASLTKVK